MSIPTLKELKQLPHVRCETDIADEAYCIACGVGGIMKGSAKRMYFFEGHGPFCRKKCFADFCGVEEQILPGVKKLGRIK